jgi:hypothetical protein
MSLSIEKEIKIIDQINNYERTLQKQDKYKPILPQLLAWLSAKIVYLNLSKEFMRT